ncbi:MAG: ExeM/NucH family extracellular endonuclease [Actinomycetota bacterium]
MTKHQPTRRLCAIGTAAALALGALAISTPPAAAVTSEVVAFDMVGSQVSGLLQFTNNAPAFSSPADGFGKFQRGVSPSIPSSVLDDSVTSPPTDTLGIVRQANVDEFFGITDTVNPDTTDPVSATWEFDISGTTDLSVSIDMGAMGNFEANDTFEWTASIDGAGPAPLFSLVADESATRTYTLASGTAVNLDDPMNVGTVELSNVLQPVTASVSGTGSTLALTLTARTDGGSEAVAFQNIVIHGDTNGGGGDPAPAPAPGDLVITEVMQNPAAVGDTAGEWFEVSNLSAQPISLDGWTISDNDSDRHTIAGPIEVPAGGYAVLGNNADAATNGGATVDYEFSGIAVANGADELVLTDPDGVEFDRIEWDGGPIWPDPTGASMTLSPAAIDVIVNDDGSNWCEATSIFGNGDLGTPGADNDTCAPPPPPPPDPTAAKIHEIQGTGPNVAITDLVEVQAVVTSLFTRDDVLDGFFIQEEDADADADPQSSEGIFVFCRDACSPVEVGDLVTVVGVPVDFFGMSQIDATVGGSITVDGDAPLPAASPVSLPAPSSTEAEDTFEALEGMVVSFPDPLVVSEYFELARYGQVVLTDAARPFQFTHLNAPSVDGHAAFLADLATRRIILDDDNNDQNDATSDGPDESYPYPGDGLSLTSRFRGGDTVTGLRGVLHWSFAGQSGTDAWRVRPIQADATNATFDAANPAPPTPEPVGGTMSIASFNVLNYFTTIDETSSRTGPCGPSGLLDCRGADSESELERQRDKIVAAILELDADVVGLVELENDGDDASIADLVQGLNAVAGPNTYDFIGTGFIGTDAIKVGFIYQPATAQPVGDFAVLDSSVDPTFVDTKNRPALVQTFEEVATGEALTVAVNHFKSKGSSCDDVGDPGLEDGQGNCPVTRTNAAVALANYLATDPTGSGDPDFMIIGDLNAYAMEDPIMALTDAGYTDLINEFNGASAYSFVFDGQLGYLDYALANASLLAQVTGVTEWHINADEIPLFDYNDAIRDAGEASFERESAVLPVYAPDALRSSDHDPLVVGLALDSTPPVPTCNGLPATHVGTDGSDVIYGTNGADVIVSLGGSDTIVSFGGTDTICAGDGNDVVFSGNGGDHVEAGDGNDMVFTWRGTDHVDADDGNDLVFAGSGRDSVLGGPGNDTIFGGSGRDDIDAGDGSGDFIDGGRARDRCINGELTTRCEIGA